MKDNISTPTVKLGGSSQPLDMDIEFTNDGIRIMGSMPLGPAVLAEQERK